MESIPRTKLFLNLNLRSAIDITEEQDKTISKMETAIKSLGKGVSDK